MKTIQKLLTITGLTACLLMNACNTSQVVSTIEDADKDSPDKSIATHSEKKSETSQIAFGLEIVTNTTGLFMTTIAGNQDGAYELYLGNTYHGSIIYYDYATMQKTYLSSQPDAPMDDTNAAFIDNTLGGVMPILAGDRFYVYKNGNYALTDSDEGDLGIAYLQKMDLTGSNKETMHFQATQWLSLTSAIAYSNTEDLFYVVYRDYNIDQPEQSTTNVGILDFNAKEFRSLVEYPAEEMIDIIDTYRDGLVLRLTTRTGESDMEYDYYFLPINSTEPELVWKSSEHGINLPVVDGEIFYLLDDQDKGVTKVNMLTGASEIVTETIAPAGVKYDTAVISLQIFDNHLTVQLYDSESDKTNFSSVDLSNGDVKELAITFFENGDVRLMPIEAETDEYFFVQNFTKVVSVDEIAPDGSPFKGDRYMPNYVLIKKEDYWNGDADCLDFTDTVFGDNWPQMQ